jgi:hypothetical protein
MYRSDKELDEVLAFQVLVGQRRHGHFDHDAHGMTGTGHRRIGDLGLSVGCNAGSPAGTRTIAVRVKVDDETGALISE